MKMNRFETHIDSNDNDNSNSNEDTHDNIMNNNHSDNFFIE
jgi:hypothetical protein